MKKHLLLFQLLIFIFSQSNAQGIFDASIHTAVDFGIVSSPFSETSQQIIDQDPNTKFLDFLIDDGMGFDVDLLGVMHIASSIQIVTANDAPERDPTSFEIFGSTDGTNYTSIATGEIPCVSERFLSRSFGFVNTTAFSFYRVNFTGTCGTSTINQVADVQLFPIIGNAPTISCPANIVAESTVGECGAVVNYDVTADDLEDGGLTASLISGLPSGSVFPLGTSAVVFSVTDADNNVVSCNFSITVSDVESPTTNCPDDITQSVVNTGDMTAIVSYDLQVMDNCSPINPLAEYTPLGSINGQSYYLSDSVFTPEEAFTEAALLGGMVGTIENADDNQFLLDGILRNNNGVADILIGLNDVLYEGLYVWANDVQPNFVNWNMGEPNNSGAGGTSENYTVMLTNGLWNDVDSLGLRRYLLQLEYEPLQTQGLSSGSEFPLGTTTNTFEIYDAAGNLITCEFTVTIEEAVSVFDQKLLEHISISPNPTNDVFTIFNESEIELENINIYDLHGKFIRSIKMNANEKYHSIDISDFNSGIYLIKILSKEGMASKKIVKY